jgi:hypothetical protein
MAGLSEHQNCGGVAGIALRIELHRPDGVIVIGRPCQYGLSNLIGCQQCIHCGRNVIVLPGHQHTLVGELTTKEEEFCGLGR